jgi:membrane protease YdiL (CAAX protease family)
MDLDQDITVRPSAGAPPQGWRLMGTIGWGIGVGLMFVIVQTAATLVVLLRGETDLSEDKILALLEGALDDGTALSIATFATTLICVPVLVGIAAMKRDSSIREYFALQPVPVRSLMGWVAILLILIALSDTLSVFLGRSVVPEFMSGAYASARPAWLFWLALVVAAPLFEEAFFRGFLFKGFASSAVGVPSAIAITSFLWAAIHLQYDLYAMATIFLMGVLYGLARASTGSLVVPLVLHAITNIVATVEAALIG